MYNKKESLKATGVNFIAILALFAVIMYLSFTGVLTRYYSNIVMLVFINIILATSLNMVSGFLGQIALGHAGFMSIGAYSAALFVKYCQDVQGMELIQKGQVTATGYIVFLVSLVIGGLLAAVFGMLVGIPALRLKGDYLAIITLGFGEIIRVVIENMAITGGAQGLKKIPRLATIPVVFWVMIITICIFFTFARSRHGRAIGAIREDDIASEAAGISNTRYKVMVFVIGAFFAGIAGAIYAQHLAVLGAKAFNFNKSIEILVIVVLGGLGSITGSVAAAIALTILPEALRSFSDYRMLIYSIVLILVMIFKPSGLLGRYEVSLYGFIKKLRGKGKPTDSSDKSGKKAKEGDA